MTAEYSEIKRAKDTTHYRKKIIKIITNITKRGKRKVKETEKKRQTDTEKVI